MRIRDKFAAEPGLLLRVLAARTPEAVARLFETPRGYAIWRRRSCR